MLHKPSYDMIQPHVRDRADRCNQEERVGMFGATPTSAPGFGGTAGPTSSTSTLTTSSHS